MLVTYYYLFLFLSGESLPRHNSWNICGGKRFSLVKCGHWYMYIDVLLIWLWCRWSCQRLLLCSRKATFSRRTSWRPRTRKVGVVWEGSALGKED